MQQLKGHSSTFWIISGFLILLTLVSMFPPQIEFLKKGSEYAVQIMLFLLVLGMTFLALRQTKLMFVSMACCAALCVFLKNASNSNIIFPTPKNAPVLSIVHINLASIDGSPEDLLNVIEDLDPDFISLQEVTPNWDFALFKDLRHNYKYKYSLVRIDPYGKAIYSKYRFTNVDTMHFNSIPNIGMKLFFDNVKIDIISTYLDPPLNSKARNQVREQIDILAGYVNEKENRVIALGDFNQVYWAEPIRFFREKTSLLNSRRNFPITNFNLPYDHIFYSSQLQCINFKEIQDAQLNHMGIYGEFQVTEGANQLADKK